MLEPLIAYFYKAIEILDYENSDFEIQPAMLKESIGFKPAENETERARDDNFRLDKRCFG